MNLKLRKLMGMSARELFFRVGHYWATAAERRQYRSGRLNWSDSEWVRRLCHIQYSQQTYEDLDVWWQHHMQDREEPVMLLGPDVLPSTVARYR